jgi:hypothetical protein
MNTAMTLSVKPARGAGEILQLVRAAVENEIAKIELGLKLAKTRLAPFEQKYGVSSEYFIAEMAAEDLEGGDGEYVNWAGEYKLILRLREKLEKLRELGYDDSDLLFRD